jgi:hypothetical protein
MKPFVLVCIGERGVRRVRLCAGDRRGEVRCFRLLQKVADPICAIDRLLSTRGKPSEPTLPLDYLIESPSAGKWGGEKS